MSTVSNSPTPLDEVVFHSARISKLQSLQGEFRKVGPDGYFQLGVIAEPLVGDPDGFKSLVHFADPYEELSINPDGKIEGDMKAPLTIVSFRSYATVEEVNLIRDQVIPMPETCRMMQSLAVAKEMQNILLLIGGTALGKTFTVETFVKLLYGPDVVPLDFYCNGQTDVSELHGMWAPTGGASSDSKIWREFLDSKRGQDRLERLQNELSVEEPVSEEQQKNIIVDKLRQIAKEIGISPTANWEYVEGAIERCFSVNFDTELRTFTQCIPGGTGAPLHIQEVGLSAPKILNTLFELGGRNGAQATSVQNWRDGGKRTQRGEGAFVVMTTNPEDEEGYLDRKGIDRALLRRVMVDRLPETLSSISLSMATLRYCCYEGGNRPESRPRGCELELYHYRDQICRPIAKAIATFHAIYVDALKAGEGEGIASAMVPSIDQIARVSDYMLRFQIIDSSGNPDLIVTLRRAVERVYLRGLKNEQLKKSLAGDLETKVFGALVPGVSNKINLVEHLKAQSQEAMNDQRSRDGGYSPEVQREVSMSHNRNLRAKSDGVRAKVLAKADVSDAVRELLQ